jgi:PilZ domain
MLSIASWRSGITKEQKPETAEVVVRRATPLPAEPAPSLAPPPTPAFDGDHRGSLRRLASTVPSISGLTLSPYGAAATLVNISTSGLLAESGVPLKIGNFVKVIFEGTFVPQSVEGRVVRICVASMASTGVRYNIGVAFKVPIELEGEVAPQSRAENRPAAVAVASPPQPSILVNRW